MSASAVSKPARSRLSKQHKHTVHAWHSCSSCHFSDKVEQGRPRPCWRYMKLRNFSRDGTPFMHVQNTDAVNCGKATACRCARPRITTPCNSKQAALLHGTHNNSLHSATATSGLRRRLILHNRVLLRCPHLLHRCHFLNLRLVGYFNHHRVFSSRVRSTGWYCRCGTAAATHSSARR